MTQPQLILDTAPVQRDFILLDRSGSMGDQRQGRSIWAEALSSINAYVEKLAADKVLTLVTLATFDKEGGVFQFDMIRQDEAPPKWNPVTDADAKPRGMTPLSDATARIVELAKAANADRTAVIIMTDGGENSSDKYPGPSGANQVKAMLDELRKKDWQIIFLGANFDNAAQAMSYGNAMGQTVVASAVNLGSTMRATAQARGLYGMTGQNMNYTAEQKRKFADDKPVDPKQ